jgi:hypothetical protein
MANFKACASCGDAIEKFKRKDKEVDPSPFCKDCFLEKTEGRIPNVTQTKPGVSGGLDSGSPWQDNAIRHMEGD